MILNLSNLANLTQSQLLGNRYATCTCWDAGVIAVSFAVLSGGQFCCFCKLETKLGMSSSWGSLNQNADQSHLCRVGSARGGNFVLQSSSDITHKQAGPSGLSTAQCGSAWTSALYGDRSGECGRCDGKAFT